MDVLVPHFTSVISNPHFWSTVPLRMTYPGSFIFKKDENNEFTPFLIDGHRVFDDPRQYFVFYGPNNKYYQIFKSAAGLVELNDFLDLGAKLSAAEELLDALIENGYFKPHYDTKYLKINKNLNSSDLESVSLNMAHLSKNPHIGLEKIIYKVIVNLKKQPINDIDKSYLSSIGLDVPCVRLTDGRIQLLDHHRIRAALTLKLPIQVSFVDIPTFS